MPEPAATACELSDPIRAKPVIGRLPYLRGRRPLHTLVHWLLLVLVSAQVNAQSLPDALQQSFRSSGLLVHDVGLVVLPVSNGRPLLAVNADEPLNPASTMKLLTTYAALAQLGPEYRWTTAAHLRGELRDGVLTGDLIFRGGGDPKFVIEDLTAFVAQMRENGLREIRGNLILDDSVFSLDDRSVEQFDGDPSQPYNVRPHGVLMNFKATKFVVTPRADTVEITMDPPLADVEIDRDIRVSKGKCRYGANGLLIRHTGTDQKPFVKVVGAYSSGCGVQNVFASVLTHRQFAHAFFKGAWVAAGGSFSGETRVERGAAKGTPWLEWRSPRTLADVTNDINKFSNNVMARQVLLLTASLQARTAATIEAARAFMPRWLETNGLYFPELVVDNGSGLSRSERISARNLAKLLQHAAASPFSDLMRTSLPRVGVDGTMKSRLIGDPVAGNAWIKTGSLNDVRTIAGYVDAASGKRWVVVMLVNGPRAELSSPAQDAVLRWVYANG